MRSTHTPWWLLPLLAACTDGGGQPAETTEDSSRVDAAVDAAPPPDAPADLATDNALVVTFAARATPIPTGTAVGFLGVATADGRVRLLHYYYSNGRPHWNRIPFDGAVIEPSLVQGGPDSELFFSVRYDEGGLPVGLVTSFFFVGRFLDEPINLLAAYTTPGGFRLAVPPVASTHRVERIGSSTGFGACPLVISDRDVVAVEQAVSLMVDLGHGTTVATRMPTYFEYYLSGLTGLPIGWTQTDAQGQLLPRPRPEMMS